MKAFNNDNLVNGLCNSCSCLAFAPVVSYTVNADNVVFSQSTTFDSGDTFRMMHVYVYDKNGTMRTASMSGLGSGATAGTVTLSGTSVATVPVSAGGTLYSTPPRVVFTGGAGSGAFAIANLTAGVVTSVTVINGGTGYTSAPTATFVTDSVQVNTTGLDQSDLDLKATIISTGGCKADLGIYEVGSVALTGNLGAVNEQGDNQ